jgi:CTP synthase
LSDLDGVLVAPGFGERGIEGKIEAIRYVRENNIPFFGICLGMQCAVVEFARNVLGYKDAASTELNKETKHPVIDLMEDQKKITDYGGTMRLGAYECDLKKSSKAYHAYKEATIEERHRHRYEFNNKYLKEMEDAGLKATGFNPKSKLVEIVELDNHPYFIGTQFHPELKSTVMSPHPLFVSFIDAMIKSKKN